MTKRNTQQRRHAICSYISKYNKASVEELAQKFNISAVTIRKDLTLLEQNGLLLRRYGGAVAVPKELVCDQLVPKVTKLKQAIGKLAAKRIKDYSRIIIDSGSTTQNMIPELEQKTGLVVMTNSISLASDILNLEPEPVLLMTGGTWDPHSEAFQGKVAEQVLHAYDFDQLFIGADGIDLERGSTTFNELIGLSKVMADVAREIIVVAESEKIGRKIPNLELAWSVIDVLVTDNDISLDALQKIKANGVEVICASIGEE